MATSRPSNVALQPGRIESASSTSVARAGTSSVSELAVSSLICARCQAPVAATANARGAGRVRCDNKKCARRRPARASRRLKSNRASRATASARVSCKILTLLRLNCAANLGGNLIVFAKPKSSRAHALLRGAVEHRFVADFLDPTAHQVAIGWVSREKLPRVFAIVRTHLRNRLKHAPQRVRVERPNSRLTRFD